MTASSRRFTPPRVVARVAHPASWVAVCVTGLFAVTVTTGSTLLTGWVARDIPPGWVTVGTVDAAAAAAAAAVTVAIPAAIVALAGSRKDRATALAVLAGVGVATVGI